jgi:polysaccharide biosynthesis/export protein
LTSVADFAIVYQVIVNMKAIFLCMMIVLLSACFFLHAEEGEVTITKIHQYVSDSDEFTIVIESDKDFNKIQEYYLEGQKYVIDFWNARSELNSVNLFENGYIKQLNVLQIQTKPDSRVRMSVDLKQGKRPKIQITGNTAKIIFEKIPSNTAANSNQTEKEYKIGPGDILEITVFENNELSTICTVPEKSGIILPLIGEVNVTNLTLQEATDLVSNKLKEYIRYPIITIKVKEYKSKWVNIMGEIREPGKQYLKGTTYLLDLISEAGGFTDRAASDIIIMRPKPGSQDMEKIIIKRESLSSESNSSNIELFNGDNVTIPTKKFYYVYGEVIKPGSFTLEEGTTILKAITQAGGFTKFGSKKNIEILRTDETNQQKKIMINIRDIEERKSPDIEIKPDDIIRVPKSIL